MACPALAQTPPVLDRLHRADGAHVLPDRFLREWDPITILFDHDAGPAASGPEDRPQRMVTMDPAPPGAWTWLGRRTLQFRPAEAWTPLQRVRVSVAGANTTLVPLLPVPVAAGPADTPSGIGGLDSVALTFPGPVDEAALARLLTIELAPQPGTADTGKQVLGAGDITITAQERGRRSDRQTYLIALRQPVPDGQIATLHLRLSDETGLDDPIFSWALHSAAPFTQTDIQCEGSYDRGDEDGVTVCKPEAAFSGARAFRLSFSAGAAAVDVVQARDALRFTPPVDDLSVGTETPALIVRGKFASDTIYHLTVAAGALRDETGRALAKPIDLRLKFAAAAPTLAWDANQGIAERFGPQMLPMRGHGYDRADLRIYPIDPLARDFWPFPHNGVATTDADAPPLPGREPHTYDAPAAIGAQAIADRITALGTPAFSGLFDLPIRRGGVDAKFGVDLSGPFAKIAGPQQPGTYLVGLRTVDGARRRWMRVQVTDLSLTAVEEAGHVRFTVTTLSTAKPVAGAELRLEGPQDLRFVTLAHGVTGADGAWTVAAPLPADREGHDSVLRRVVVVKGTDTLVLDPARGPPRYAQGQWNEAAGPWLDWLSHDPAPRAEPARTLCHVFTERPIYRPEEPVLVAGMVRTGLAGTLSYASGDGEVVVHGPNDQEWRVPAPLDDIGGFHVRFDAKTEATGDYSLAYVPHGEAPCGTMRFKKEAYRLPTFEVLLAGPPKASLDAPFDVGLTARFFAGGLLSDRPITWRVTQEPYVWSPPGRDGFVFSSDSRFSGDSEFRYTPVLTRDAKTDVGGAARLTLDPTLEPTAQPRQYLVEATVTGDDDMQVRSTQRISALPPFVLGVNVPRYIDKPGAIDARLLALDGDGHAVAGLPMTVRLIHRQWNSMLQASDFAQGSAKYETEVLDQTIEERKIVAGADATPIHFAVAEAGVYLVELEATDRAGRTQKMRVDLFMAGDTPVTWSRPPSQTVTITADHEKYDPGDSASLVVQSPFQAARALMVVEEPEGRFRYDWIDIRNGFGRYSVPLRKAQVPRLAVHALLMRGRLPGPTAPGAPFDQGKPVTLAATKWLVVNPIEHEVRVSFDAPAEARPAQTIDLVLHLVDAHGHPLAGEATVWLVDQAVPSLAREQPLNPVPDFIVDRPTRLVARDSRSMAFGVLPLSENPGGDGQGEHGMANISVRKNFTPVPFYAPRVKVGPDGTAHLSVKLADSLTVFMLRAKAVSGPDRFGFGTGEIRVRQPVVAQAALPRFVRPGDRFEAGVLARVVEGPGGAGVASIETEHLHVDSPAKQAFAFDGGKPARLESLVSVPEPAPGVTSARILFRMQRTSDQAGDAVQLDLPIRPDRAPDHRRVLLQTQAGNPPGATIPAEPEAMRPASYERRVTLSTDPDLVRLVAGLDLLLRAPVDGTEQRTSLAQAELALLPFAALLDRPGLRDRVTGDVAAALQSITRSTDDDGRVAFWPGVPGSIWFSADAYELLVMAKRAGLPVDKPQMDRLASVLTAALRSDYPHLMSGYELFERVCSLAALADGGTIDAAYAAELARRARSLPTGGVAFVTTALSRLPEADGRLRAELLDVLWSRINVLSRGGKPVYGGLQDQPMTEAILPSEARSLANAVQAVALATPDDPRLNVLRAGLVGLADGDGWGTTNATAAALRALAATWKVPEQPAPATITLPEGPVTGRLDADHPLLQGTTHKPGAVGIQAPPGLSVLGATDGTPAERGSRATPRQSGLVVTRHFFRVQPSHPLARMDPDASGAIRLKVGDVIEEVDDLASLASRSNLALHAPLAAGMEPLNPALATATADATPSAPPTVPASYASYGDDEVLLVWLSFPKGTATLRTRLRATVPGTYTAPPASAEALYNPGVAGASAGGTIIVSR